MAKFDIRPDFERLVAVIASRNSYRGNPVSKSIMAKFEIVMRPSGGGGILVPFWLPVLEWGRGPRKSKTDSGLVYKIEKWMRKRGMFHSKTKAGQFAEAKSMTWYLNKHGNAQYNAGNRIFVDIYTKAREQTIQDIYAKYSLEISRITKPLI